MSAAAMTSASDEKWRPFNCLFSRVGLRTYQHPCITPLSDYLFTFNNVHVNSDTSHQHPCITPLSDYLFTFNTVHLNSDTSHSHSQNAVKWAWRNKKTCSLIHFKCGHFLTTFGGRDISQILITNQFTFVDKQTLKTHRLSFKRRIKSHLPFAGIIRSSPYSPRFQDNG